MDISIIIVNYNVKEYIISCIESIYKHTSSKYEFEIIIIDNNSTDGSQNAIKKSFKNIKLFENSQNFGFSKAVNQGVKKATGDYLFILNPDTLFSEDTITKMADEAKSKNLFAACGPMIVNNDGQFEQSFWKEPTVISTILSIYHMDFINTKKNYKYQNYDEISNVDTISGCAIFIPRLLFIKFGGFNEKLFWMEDIDLCIRLKKSNFGVFYFPKTKITHFAGKSAKTNYNIAISNQLISKIKYFKIHHSIYSYYIISIFVITITIIKLFFFMLAFSFSSRGRRKFAAYFFTLRRLVNREFHI